MKWIDPPRKTKAIGAPVKFQEEAEALSRRPGEWALIFEGRNSATTASYINAGDLAAFRPAGSFEAKSRKNPEGKFDIYARFVGSPE
jgi:hypothetical protein